MNLCSSPSGSLSVSVSSEAASALNTSGLESAGNRRFVKAIEAFQRASKLDPGAREPRLNLGVALAQAGEPAEALLQFEQVVERWPDYLEGRLNLAKALSAHHRHLDAIKAFRDALAIDPRCVDALNGLGLSLTHLGRAREATIVLRQALRLDSRCAGGWSNLGFALATLARYADAEAAFLAALRLSPSLPEAHVNRGNALKEQGRIAEAIACYDLAILLNADAGSARWNRSLALLQNGDFDRGWEEYEARWDRDGNARRRSYDAPTWDGRSPCGRTILVYSEQGLGDMVMFVRYAALLKKAGATVLLETPAPLAAVMSSCPAIDRVFPEGSALPPVDAVVPAMSLPRLLHTRLDSIPADVPYLHADTTLVARHRQRLAQLNGLTVGVIWQGNPSHQWDRHRSVPLSSLAPLAQVPDIRLVSLQRGPGTEQLSSCPFAIEEVIRDQPSESAAVADLAAWIASVDLVVTVDTMPAHLAGAMAVPVWVMLSTMVDWRWMNDRLDSPWYPTMRLFRQRQRDQWEPVISEVASALQLQLVGQH
ncbi:tetratricopeptide repeat protein [Humisphaera borealis]|uniref:Glycosyltransferase family protein n=1 Tax=Humisphaera borealis TaxID=2807512 RepID=A0A7M2WRQ8_9BACT|nr:tetratricopeptide repeat-containing glycosyltransferase family protein [Humisphaera borealis]QOV87944.1 glycosyltransferase family protein [Humisphaera borealis]